jgi:hypothetical protein
MSACCFIAVRVTPEIKAAFHACAERQNLRESVLLRRLLDLAVGTVADGRPAAAQRVNRAARTARLSIRLAAEDQQLLVERAKARSLPAATYVSLLVNTHLLSSPALPHQELRAVTSAINALNALGRNLNQIARLANQGIPPDGPTRQQLANVAHGCRVLSDQVRSLIAANAKSWEAKL